MPDLITSAGLSSAADLEGVSTAELKAAIDAFNKQNTKQGEDIEGEARELLLRMGKNMLSTFGERGQKRVLNSYQIYTTKDNKPLRGQ